MKYKYRKTILCLGCIGLLAGAAWQYAHTSADAPQKAALQQILLTSDDQRRNWLAHSGFSTDAADSPQCTEVTLPETASEGIYGAFCALQQQQALPLSVHVGETACLWIYTSSSDPNRQAALLCGKADGLLYGAMQYDCTCPAEMYPLVVDEVEQTADDG